MLTTARYYLARPARLNPERHRAGRRRPLRNSPHPGAPLARERSLPCPPGAPEAGTDYSQFAPLRERVWGLQVLGDRLYYGVWQRDSFQSGLPNEVWSVQLDPAGHFLDANADQIADSKQLEIQLPLLQATNKETCCQTTSQLFVPECADFCCEGIKGEVVNSSAVPAGGGLYAFTPTLSAAGNVTRVTATVVASSLVYVPASCGTSGPVNSYVATPLVPVAGLSAQLPVPGGREVVWTSASAAGTPVNNLAFPFNIQFPPPPTTCAASLTFYVKFTFTDKECRTCEIIRPFGPYLFLGQPLGGGGGVP